jgi:hypothetical protein
MSSPTTRSLTIDDPVAAAVACHVAHPTAGRLREIPLEEIRPNAAQPRKRFDQASLDALADSIRERGVLQPIIVAPLSAGGYQLIAGRASLASLADRTSPDDPSAGWRRRRRCGFARARADSRTSPART